MKNTTEITTTSKQLGTKLKANLASTIIYTLIVSVLSALLVFCYFSVFSSFYLKSFSGKHMIGVVDVSTYNSTNKGDIIYVESYASTNSIRVGDEIFYSGNVGKGSGIVEQIKATYLVINCNGVETNMTLSAIYGKVTGKTAFWGYILWFLQSYVGVAVLTVLLVVIVVSKLVLSIFVETTPKGRELQKKLKLLNAEVKNNNKMHRQFRKSGLDIFAYEVLSGSYSKNKQYIQEFAKKQSVANAYLYILQKVHRAYVVKEKLSIIDKVKITNCVNLMCMCNKFDSDVEYMLSDLILHSKMIGFDVDGFYEDSKQFLRDSHSTDEYFSFVSTLYLLCKQNSNLRCEKIYFITELIESKLIHNKENKSKSILNITNYVKNLINF